MAVINLRKQANKKNEGNLQYVKGGLSTFFEAQDALSGKCQNYKRNLGILMEGRNLKGLSDLSH